MLAAKDRRFNMVPEQKRAWFIVIFFGVCLVLFIGLLAGSTLPLVRAINRSFCWFGPMLLILPLLFRKKRVPGAVAEDERDRIIAGKATLAGGMSSFVAVVLVCIIPHIKYWIQGKELIDIDILSSVLICGLTALFTVRSIVVLVMYKWGVDIAED